MAEFDKLRNEVEKLKEERQNTADRISVSMRLTAIGQLAAGVAHELNNPLSVILGYAQSLSHHLGDHDSLLAALKTIEREALRCKRLVQDLLNFSRLPKPGKVMEDIVQVLEGALTLVETQARIQHVELLRDFTQTLPSVYIDRHRVQQLMINLCTNAMDAMPKGGKLSVRAALVSDTSQAAFIEIAISDTGTGIPQDIRERIFEPFFTTKERGKGTGLGLSLVREVVKEHQGGLEVLSEENRGTTFTIRLPAGTRSVPPQPDGNPIADSSSLTSKGPGQARRDAR